MMPTRAIPKSPGAVTVLCSGGLEQVGRGLDREPGRTPSTAYVTTGSEIPATAAPGSSCNAKRASSASRTDCGPRCSRDVQSQCLGRLFDTGHLAPETHVGEIAATIRDRGAIVRSGPAV